LSGLNDAELVTFVDTAAGYELGDTGAAFAHALYRETDGNPFFAWEVMQHLAESGVVARSGSGEWTGETGVAELGLPASVREVIGRRVARLGEDAQHALRMAAVIGAHIELDVLSTALGIEADTVLDILEGAERSGLLRATGPERFGWTHALIQHSLYAELTQTRRARAHRQVAEAFETLGMADTRVQDLARHWAAAVRPADATKAIEYARRAGDDALATLAPDAAARSYAQALELLDQQPIRDDALRCDLLLCIAVARQQAGDARFRDFVLEAANLAQQLGDTDRLVQAALTDYVRGYVAVGDVDRVRLLEAALVAVGEGASVDRARLLAALSFELNFADPQYAVDITVEAIALARRIGDPKTLGYVLRVGTGHHFVPASASIWLADAREAIELAERAGEPADIFRSEYNLYGAAIIGGDATTALEALRHMTKLADEIPRPDFRWMARFLGADQALLAGDAETAERLVNEAYAVGSATAQPGALTIYAAGLNNVRWFQGRQAEAQLVMEQAAAADEDLSLLHLDTSVQAPDDGSPARPTLAEAVERLPRDGAWLPAISIYADVAGRDHDIIAAETIYEQMAPFSSLVVAATGIYRGAVTHYLGVLATVLGRYDDAGAHFADALAVHERLRAPFHLARTELEWARMLLARDAAGDHERALDLLQHARDRAYEHGCAQLERRARRLLDQTG
jgi:tetratricopeptide (TPR) repeat protein